MGPTAASIRKHMVKFIHAKLKQSGPISIVVLAASHFGRPAQPGKYRNSDTYNRDVLDIGRNGDVTVSTIAGESNLKIRYDDIDELPIYYLAAIIEYLGYDTPAKSPLSQQPGVSKTPLAPVEGIPLPTMPDSIPPASRWPTPTFNATTDPSKYPYKASAGPSHPAKSPRFAAPGAFL